MVVVEVRQGTLTWIAVEQEEDEEDEEDDEEEEERRTRQEEEATDIKSNNPHLAGGEKLVYRTLTWNICIQDSAETSQPES